jgi:putative acetyltransferase
MTAITQTRVSDASDLEGIRHVHEKSFGRKAEANLVETLLASDVLIKDLSIVAIEQEQIVGHILYTRVDIINDKDGSNSSQGTYAIALAPLAVLPEFQKKALASA